MIFINWLKDLWAYLTEDGWPTDEQQDCLDEVGFIRRD